MPIYEEKSDKVYMVTNQESEQWLKIGLLMVPSNFKKANIRFFF
jgi:hypothetical protein